MLFSSNLRHQGLGAAQSRHSLPLFFADPGRRMKHFHPFRLDTVNQCLWHRGKRAPLTPKAFDVLRYLVEHSDRLVPQDEILEALWSETYVNPEVIKKYILEIRKVLGDNPDQPQFVQTFPKRGYQFVATVSDEKTSASADVTESQANIVGREAELSALDGLLDKALRGQRQVVFVTGEAGIGKTTLADALQYRYRRIPNLRFARGQCAEGFGGKEAYYPFLEAVGQFLRCDDGSASLEMLAKRAPTWLVQFPSLVKREQRDDLQREILGATRERMVREICEALEAITAETSMLLVLEDLHWADPSTLDLISALARQRGAAKLFLLGTYRPVDVALSQSPLRGLKQDLLVHHLCHEIALERLEEANIADYLAAKFPGSEFAVPLARLIYNHSGGNSLFMVAIVQDLLEKGVIANQKDGWSVTVPLEDFAPGVPETLQQLLEVQFDGLSAFEQRVLRNASVIGERFTIRTLSSMFQTSLAEIEDLCETLGKRQQFIRYTAIQTAPNGETAAQYEFIHSLHRQVLYRQLSEASRIRLHRTVGERLAQDCMPDIPEMASEIALHFELGHEHLRAAEYLLLTAENATRKFAYKDSVQILEHALALASKKSSVSATALEIRILGRIGDTYYALGNMVQSAESFEKEANRAAQASLKAAEVNALSCLARTMVLIDGDQGLQVCQRAIEACHGLVDPLLVARTQMLAATLRLGYDEWRREDAGTCASAKQTIRSLADANDPSYQEIWHAHLPSLQGQAREALRTCEAAISKYEMWNTDRQTLHTEHRDSLETGHNQFATTDQNSSLVGYVLALSAKSIALLHLGKLGPALDIMREARARAEKNGSSPWIFILREAWVHLAAFDFLQAQELCATVVAANAGYLTRHPKAIALIARGYTALHKENYAEASRCFREVRNQVSTQKFFLHWYWRMQAELGLSNALLEAGDVAAAAREADRFLESALSTSDPSVQALAWSMKSRAGLASKENAMAEHALVKGLAIVNTCEVPLAGWQVHSAAWEFYGYLGEADRAEQHRCLAESLLVMISESLDAHESLRNNFLNAAPIRRVLDAARRRKLASAR